MISWTERSRAQAAMLNPAILAAVTANAAAQYVRTRSDPMPWSLAFLIAPLVLHKGTRDALPRNSRTHLSTWIAREPVVHAGIAERAVQLRPLVLEGIRFGLRYGALVLAPGGLEGHVVPGAVDAAGVARLRRRGSAEEQLVVAELGLPGDLGDIIAKAGFVGRWMTKIDNPATAYVMLGLTP